MWHKYLLYVAYLFIMSQMMGCTTGQTYVSHDLLPGYDYRPIPNVHINEFDDIDKLQAVCHSLMLGRWLYFKGCATVPADPRRVCTVYVMRGDEETLRHEMGHCHGYADTTNYYDAHPDYLEGDDE